MAVWDAVEAAEHPAPAGLPVRYRLIERLGKGGQGHTWLAADSQADPPDVEIALKVFRLGSDAGWKAFDLFERECRVLRSLDHPRIPTYVDHGGDEETGVFWLAMQCVRGTSLQQAIDDGRRHTDAVLERLLRQTLELLDYLHELNPPVYHRDIKPANIIIDDSGDAWLVDFGGVREALLDRGKSTVVGTFGYMAPEQMRGHASPASDIYGLGATLAAVASGTDASELPAAGLDIDLGQCMKPGRMRDTLQAMLRADPRQRLPNAAAAREFLDHGPPAPPSTPAPDRAIATRPPTAVAKPRRLASLTPRSRAVLVGVSAAAATGMTVVGIHFVIALGVASVLFFALAQLTKGILHGLQED